MWQQSISHPSQAPGRRPRVLIEDERLADLPLERAAAAGVDVRVCSGPQSEREACPLVTDGACPLGSFDAVVSALHGPWAQPVRRAWSQQNTVMAKAQRDAELSLQDQLDAHVGAALQAVFRAQYFSTQCQHTR